MMELVDVVAIHTVAKLVISPDDARVFVKILKICVYLWKYADRETSVRAIPAGRGRGLVPGQFPAPAQALEHGILLPELVERFLAGLRDRLLRGPRPFRSAGGEAVRCGAGQGILYGKGDGSFRHGDGRPPASG